MCALIRISFSDSFIESAIKKKKKSIVNSCIGWSLWYLLPWDCREWKYLLNFLKMSLNCMELNAVMFIDEMFLKRTCSFLVKWLRYGRFEVLKRNGQNLRRIHKLYNVWLSWEHKIERIAVSARQMIGYMYMYVYRRC